MTSAADTLLAQFDGAAKEAQATETAMRKAVAQQIAATELRRAHAFRRARLVRALAMSVPAAKPTDCETDDDGCWNAQRQAVGDELGWSTLSENRLAILARMQPLAAEVARCVSEDGDRQAAPVSRALAEFESWFADAHGKPFYVLFDQYVPEVPVVDF